MPNVCCVLAIAITITLYAQALTYYVDASRADDTGSGLSWDTAKKTIQAAVDLSGAGDTVLVTNGVYKTGKTTTPGYSLNNRVVIINDITVRSINGPDVTVIEGSGTNEFNTLSAVRCVYMKRGILDGFTLQNGATYGTAISGSDAFERCGGGVNMNTSSPGTSVTNCIIRNCVSYRGGGAFGGALSKCIVLANSAPYGGASRDCTLSNCLLSRNSAYCGGGSDNCTLNACTLVGNTAQDGGGTYNCILRNCVLMGNTVTGDGGGAAGGSLDSCTISGNVANRGGGTHNGTMNNSVLSGNVASSVGGGAHYGTLRNCIVWANNRRDGTCNNYEASSFSYSCTTPLPSGSGNIEADPQFVDAQNFMLRVGSPCLDTGNNGYVTVTTDLAGNPRIQNGTVDMGAYEGGVLAAAVPVFDPPSGTLFTNTLLVTITCETENAVLRYTLDGSDPTESSAEYTEPITLNEATTVVVISSKPGFLSSRACAKYRPNIYFIDASRSDDSGAGTSWETAKKTIQAGVDLAIDGDTVLVTNGVYNIGSTVTPGHVLRNRVVIENAITLKSVNGPADTIITGSGTNWYNTSSAVRCVYMKEGVLDGFTLKNGATFDYGFPGADYDDLSGGGVNMSAFDSIALVTNCVVQDCKACYGGGAYYGTLLGCTLSGNTAIDYGGGSYRGALGNCSIFGNSASSGGGVSDCKLSDCVLTGNQALFGRGGGAYDSDLDKCHLSENYADYNGGAYGGLLSNCVLTANSAYYDGGGAGYSAMINCTVSRNSAGEGGGVSSATLDNCVLVENTADQGGGSYSGTLNNCTLVRNVSDHGGGAYYGTLNNCIVWGNTKHDDEINNYETVTFHYSCTSPLPSGAGNIDADPLFVDTFSLRLRNASPCVDVGDNVYVSALTDLTGNPRIQNGIVEMGAYEGGVIASATPTFDPPTGTRFPDTLDVAVSCITEGAVIHYTLDGSEPCETSEVYAVTLRLTGSAVLRAKAFKDGLVAAQAMAVYTRSVSDPVISPSTGTVGTNALTVTIACETAAADIRYTLDGAEPTEASPAYTNTITLTGSATIKAKAFKPGLAASRTVASAFTVIQAVATPVFNPPSHTIATNSLTVFITCAPPWANIRYTLDGSVPTTENGNSYWGQIVLTQSATVKARAFYYEMADSAVASADYTVLQTIAAPIVLPADGTIFTGLRKVTMSCATPGVEIYFTTNGVEPTLTSTRYMGPFNISKTTAFRVRAFKDGMADSPVVTATYYTLSPLSEALDVTNLVVTTYTWSPWLPQSATTLDGVDAAQSGLIRDNGSTLMEARVTGPGTLSFWWKVSCEDDPDADNWDYLRVSVDATEMGRLDGIVGWARAVCPIGTGTHTIRWEYRKDESVSDGADCGWVDRLAFVAGDSVATSSTPVPVPHDWLDRYPALFGPSDWDYETAAQSDADGDGHAAWQEYVAGTVPTNSESALRALIAVSNGMPWIAWSPDLGTARVYTVEGSTNLADAVWYPTNAGSRFFRIRVNMP